MRFSQFIGYNTIQMVFQKYIILFIVLTITSVTSAQKFGFTSTLDTKPQKKMPFAVPNTIENQVYLSEEGITMKRTTENWIFITATPDFIQKSARKKRITDFYFEYAPPSLLDDTARVMHKVNEVHNGLSPLQQAYTGKDVIVGIVDEGLDHRHPDFIKPNGDSRVIRYWDHSILNPTQTPSPYNYGQVWYASQINDGTITSNEESSGHGTTVTGICASNGLANGTNKGMAPESDIIFVETNFNLPNWTLSIADACDYIFKVADSLGKPAVVNLSLGTYLGSHDGTDPASELMESMLEEQNGRLIICAAGNSGRQAPYHVHGNMNLLDTNFVWFENNPSGAFGNNTVFFDLWSDIDEAQFDYAFGANLPGPSYGDRAETVFRGALDNIGSTVFDTLWNSDGERIATLQVFTETVGSNFHLQGYCSSMDSTDYRLRFSTTGVGKYDLWSGTFLGLNEIVYSIPTVSEFPPIIDYIKPDTLQSIVSSWNCSDKVVSVGNLRCRLGHIDNNGNQYYPATDMTSPGKIAPSSSRGPARTGVLKPDISASGDVTLGSGPFWILNNPTYNSLIDNGGFHVRNGGTSMASPTVAGIAALYLEKCGSSSWSDFKQDLQSSAIEDGFTGTVPNYEYGAGKVDAFNLMLETSGGLKLLGDTVVCQTPTEINTNIPLQSYEWSNGENTSSVLIDQVDTIWVFGRNTQGCKVYSDTFEISVGNPLPNPVITTIGQSLISSNGPSYQWYLNDNALPGETGQVIYPDSNGYYSVSITGPDGCSSFSNAEQWTLSLEDFLNTAIHIYPNPTNGLLNIESDNETLNSIVVRNTIGQALLSINPHAKKVTLELGNLSSGNYLIEIETDINILIKKISIQ